MSSAVAYHGEVKEFTRITEVLSLDSTAHAGQKVITRAMIDEAKRRHRSCRCEDPPWNLRPGMTLKELNALSAGCNDMYICPTLDKLRRMMGH